jgi:hypothetical protein
VFRPPFGFVTTCGLGPVLLGALALAACGPGSETATGGAGGGGEGGAGAGPPSLAIVFGAPEPAGDPPEQASFPVEGYASAAGARGGLTAAGTTLGVYSASVEGMEWLPIVGDEPDLPLETGIVRAMAPIEEGVLVAAETGLYVAANGALTRSNGHAALHPLGIEGLSTRISAGGDGAAPEAFLTLRTAGGLVEWRGGELVTWQIGDETGAPSAALAQEERLFAAWGSRVYEIDRAGGLAYPLLFDIGQVRDIACSSLACDAGSVLYFATDLGLVERSATGEYTLYTLAPEGDPFVPVAALALDGGKQRLYALTGGALLRVHAGSVPDEIAPLATATFPRHAAVDKAGDVWSLAGGEATRLATGTPLSFATDIQPIMGEYCAPCHEGAKNGAPEIDFEEYGQMAEIAGKALMRVQDGSMPPPSWPQIPAEQVQLLAEWVATKAP